MNQFKEFDDLLKTYNQLNIIQSKDEFDKIKIDFVYHSNRLEGSNLTLFQTEDIINTHYIKGEAALLECLMAIDNYRALNIALTFGANKYPLTEKIVLNIHQSLLKNSFEIDPAFASWKDKGQVLGEFKISTNRIRRTENGKDVYYSTPDVKESKEYVLKALALYNYSSEHFLEKLSKLVQNMYNAHAFFDGNKRMTRLIIANQLLANKLPLMVLHNNGNEYNEALFSGFVNKTNNAILKLLKLEACRQLNQKIELVKLASKSKNNGFRLII
ncbi:MAG: Fic family protein [Vicingaceae bacterium]|nr:Fic family protein [Vicingaceae bacterium]